MRCHIHVSEEGLSNVGLMDKSDQIIDRVLEIACRHWQDANITVSADNHPRLIDVWDDDGDSLFDIEDEAVEFINEALNDFAVEV